MLPIPNDHSEGVEWVRRLNSTVPEIKAEAKKSPPKAFFGNYICPDFSDSRIFFSAVDWPIKAILNSSNIYNERVPLKLKASRFIRDSCVTLFPHGILIPYSIKDPILFNRFLALLPSSSSRFILNEINMKYKAPYGKGFKIKKTTSTMSICYRYHIPFKQAKSCIEGGNCFLFMSKGQKKAVIGEHSIVLSMIALEEQGLFQEIDISQLDAPSLEAVRLARNLHLYEAKQQQDHIKYIQAKKEREEQVKKEEKLSPSRNYCTCIGYIPENPLAEEEVIYRKSLIAPLSEEEKKEYFEAGKLIEAKLKATKQMIAEELGVCLNDVAFIPQTEFHIDMELLALPDGRIVLHDAAMVEKFLESIRQQANLDEENLDLLNEYVNASKRKAEKNKAIRERSIEVLRAHNIDCDCMPMVFKASKIASNLNYCNGIFMNKGEHRVGKIGNDNCFIQVLEEGYFFATTGPSTQFEELIHQRFVDLFNSTYQDYTCVGINGMSKFIQRYGGGVHCLSLNVSPIGV